LKNSLFSHSLPPPSSCPDGARRFPNRTKRDAWAGSFEELLTLDSPRTDCPLHFPESPPVAAPWTCPGCHNPPSELRRLAESTEPEGQHCSATRRVCEGSAAVTDRQKRIVRQLSALLVSDHDIAGIWVAFFSRCQRYRC